MYFFIDKSKFLKSIKITSKSGTDDFNEFYHKLEVEILKIIHQSNPTALIFGIPQKMAEKEYYQHNQIEMRTLIKGFLQKCDASKNPPQEKQHLINYTLVDESWTTKQATWKLKDIEQAYSQWGHLHKQKQLIDGMAAMKILQRYLTYYNS